MRQGDRNPPGRSYRVMFDRAARRRVRNQCQFFAEVEQEFGDVALIRIGPSRLCLISRPELIREVLATRAKEVEKGVFFKTAQAVLGQGLLTSEGDFHLRQRRLIQPAFHARRLEACVPALVAASQAAGERWRDGTVIDMFQDMSRLALDIGTQVLFGVELDQTSIAVRSAVAELLKSTSLPNVGLAMVLHQFGVQLPVGLRVMFNRWRLNSIIDRILADRRRAGSESPDLLGLLMRARDHEGDGRGMSDRQLRHEVMTFLLVGHETTASMLSWLWYVLAQYPDVDRRMQAELATLGPTATLTAESLLKLDYTRRVIAETLRLYPVVWMIVRHAKTKFEIGGYEIPAGTEIMVSPFVVQRSPKYFPDPLKFDPDRWLPEHSAGRHPFTFFPFGGGPHLCIGEPLAWLQGLAVAAVLTPQWRAELTSREPVEFKTGVIVLRPKNGLPLMLRRRTPLPTSDQADVNFPAPANLAASSLTERVS